MFKYIHENKMADAITDDEMELRNRLRKGNKVKIWKRCKNKATYGKFVRATCIKITGGFLGVKLEDGRERWINLQSKMIKRVN